MASWSNRILPPVPSVIRGRPFTGILLIVAILVRSAALTGAAEPVEPIREILAKLQAAFVGSPCRWWIRQAGPPSCGGREDRMMSCLQGIFRTRESTAPMRGGLP
jgi:hypothetical protein